jgi:hypothetical protein
MIHRLVLLSLLFASSAAGIRATDKEGATTATPITSPWDANAWEAGSDHAFWRAGAEKAKAPASNRVTTPRTAVITSPTASPSRADAKPDFSSRQSEK